MNLMGPKINISLSGNGAYRESIVTLLTNNNNMIEISLVWHLKYMILLFILKLFQSSLKTYLVHRRENMGQWLAPGTEDETPTYTLHILYSE